MKVRPFNSVAEGLLYVLLLVSLGYNIYSTNLNANAANEARMIASENQKQAEAYQKQTVEARQANIQRQNIINEHIDCVVLLRFYTPPLTASSTKEDYKAALKSCAEVE